MKYSITMKKAMTILTAALLVMAGTITVWAATKLDTVTDPYWDEDTYTLARWDQVEYAKQYQVYLYRDDSKIAEIKTKNTKYNFKSKMMVEGSYTFRVKALKKNNSYVDSNWSEYSDEMYINAAYIEFLENGGVIDTQNSGPGAAAAGQTTSDTGVVYTPGWIQDESGWWYRNSDGTYPVNAWLQEGGNWYYFNEQGYMVTGWFDWNGNRYYCGESGAMYSGESTIDGMIYRFDQSGALTAS